jgi:hypothetical protein
MRYEDRARTLWVDALWINQEGIEEQGHQVGRMGYTYRQASCVIVWLGQDAAIPEKSSFRRYYVPDGLTTQLLGLEVLQLLRLPWSVRYDIETHRLMLH